MRKMSENKIIIDKDDQPLICLDDFETDTNNSWFDKIEKIINDTLAQFSNMIHDD